MATKIRLAHYNSDGLVADLVDDSPLGGDCRLVLRRQCDDPAMVCKLAAKRLRRLARAFDLLAVSSRPTHGDSQKQAMKESAQ